MSTIQPCCRRQHCAAMMPRLLVFFFLSFHDARFSVCHGFVSNKQHAVVVAPRRSGAGLMRDSSSSSLSSSNDRAHDAMVDEIFDEFFAESIARDVYESLDVPFYIPQPVVTYLMEQTVQNLSSDLSQDTKLKLQEMMEARATPSKDDDFAAEDINALADAMAAEINPNIDVPVLDEAQEYVLLQQILRVVLQSIGQADNNPSKSLISSNLDVSVDLLAGPESRQRLAKSIDAKMMAVVQLPLEESQRLAIISKAVDSSADMLTRLLPPDLLESLKGESTQGLLNIKEYLIDTVNAKVDIVGLDETQERQLIDTMINLLIDEYVDGTNAEFLLLTPDEQEERLIQRQLELQRRKEFAQRRLERELSSLDCQLARVNDRLKTIRQGKSVFQRVFGRGKQ